MKQITSEQLEKLVRDKKVDILSKLSWDKRVTSATDILNWLLSDVLGVSKI